MRSPAPHDKRQEDVLAEVVRTYIQTGEPVSSRAVSHRYAEPLSSATIRNVMAELEHDGYLHQPHTSAGRVPTADAYRFFVQHVAAQVRPDEQEQKWIRAQLAAATTPEELMERTSHVLATISHGLGIILSPPLARTAVEHLRFLRLPEGRVLVVLIARGGTTRDKVIAPGREFSQEELDRTADYLNRHYRGRTLEAIRADLLALLDRDHERYDQLASNALLLCASEMLDQDAARQVYVEGAAQIATAPEFTDQEELRELLAAIEEKRRLVELLTGCIEAPEPLFIQIGIKEMSSAGEKLALISAPYSYEDQVQGSLGVLGPLRMPYERAIAAVAYLAQLFSSNPSGAIRP
jgi:heat-inducible transcriptional repressor